MSFFRRLMSIDRRFIYIVLSIALVWPMLRPIGFFRPPIQNTAVYLYDTLTALPEDSTIIFSADFPASVLPEIAPLLKVVTNICLQRKHRILLISLHEGGSQRALRQMEPVLNDHQALYGIDYLVLGDMQPYPDFLQAAGTNLPGACRQYGQELEWPFNAYPILKGVEKARDVSAVISFSSGDPGYTHWIQYWQSTGYTDTILVCTSSVQYAFTLSALNAGVLKGVAGGELGAYTLESCLGIIGAGHARLDSLGLGQSTILLFILLGNIGYIGARMRGELHKPAAFTKSRRKRIIYSDDERPFR